MSAKYDSYHTHAVAVALTASLCVISSQRHALSHRREEPRRRQYQPTDGDLAHWERIHRAREPIPGAAGRRILPLQPEVAPGGS